MSDKLPEILPILPLFETILFPKMILPIVVIQGASSKLIDDAMSKDRMIGILSAKISEPKDIYSQNELYEVGTVAVILKMSKTEEEKVQLLIQGISRFKAINFIYEKSYQQAQIERIDEIEFKDKEADALATNLVGLFRRIIELSPGIPKEIFEMASSIQSHSTLADMITSVINVKIEEKQKILEIQDFILRLTEVTKIANYQLEVLELGHKIQTQIKTDMDKQQREYYLRHQLKVIQDELGEKDESKFVIEEYQTKINQANMPSEALKEAEREINRLKKMHPSSFEYTVSLTYLDWLIALPWSKGSLDNLDIKKVREILDQDHFGLEKIKKRIIEYLAVRQLNPESKGPILCFVGPPGVGKTSLGRSIANALGRKFVRISLGGVRDEAEIRGHRRTYVGALPGRIIQGIRRVESNNPVFMLDEIDKVGTDFRGDPSSALLEVLDPEQNFSFSDHYLDVPFNLSKVMFITTANILDTIPSALKDRMEVISLSGYTEDEKINITNRFIIPRQLRENGLDLNKIVISANSVKRIISEYTREAGLRNLEREIGSICRSIAAKTVENANNKDKPSKYIVNEKYLKHYLGSPKFNYEVLDRISRPGIAVGLAWTQVGGDILFIESTAMKGKNNLTLTGQLGDVMKESAMAALSFIRANSASLKISNNFFETHDIHVHIPAGAIPKDGPSAGVTILTSLMSLILNKPIKKNLAMTGEITLRGKVLPVGGIKEKILAAHRAKIDKVILPKRNQSDLEDIPKKVKQEINFTFVEEMTEVLKIALNQAKLSNLDK